MAEQTAASASVSLDDKFEITHGRIFINGNQALVRLPLIQQELDRQQGLNTAGYLTGYRGSPLGGLDATLWREQRRLEAHNIVFQPGMNEDLAATAVWGTQQLAGVENPKYDGVFSYWYGKGPGVDRSGDPLKHGNYNGTNRNGGVLVLYGDDHPGKSSTIAHQSEQALAANSIPSLYPASVAEFIEFGLYGWALSRYCGLWVGFKTVNETVEQTATVDIDLDKLKFDWPERGELPVNTVNIENDQYLLPVISYELNLNRYRLPLLHRFVRANPIDKTPVVSSRRKLGIVTAGKAYTDVVQALQLLGIDEQRAEALGLSVYKVGLIWPLEPEGLKAFAAGHEELLFIEEKRAFMEPQAASILFNEAERPRIIGKVDEAGASLLPVDEQLEPRDVARVIAGRLRRCGSGDAALDARLDLFGDSAGEASSTAPAAVRGPYFCSGCPHNTSTRVPEGSVAMAGIGCHTMAAVYRPDTVAPAHMGGEGAQWSGLQHFCERDHVFQNMGDGTFFHSGLMCVRNSVATGANITYKILYNDAVAMTGGQPVDGQISVADMARQVLAERIRGLALVSDDPAKFRSGDLPAGVEVYHRDELDHVQKTMRKIPGTTVIIYEQTCAAEKRRRRKRGTYPDPAQRLFINQEVCEGCGDCSKQSTCVSLEPVETSRGTKRAIDQSSCNKDYSCKKGFCPSFVTVRGGSLRKAKAASLDDSLFAALPAPRPCALDGAYGVMVAGIGGTGVITVSAVLGMAAHIDGKAASIFDMTGLSQKNGAVFSHLKIATDPGQLGAQKLGLGDAQLLMGFDLVASVADDAFRSVGPATRVIGNSKVTQTVLFQLIPGTRVDDSLLVQRLNGAVGSDNAHYVDATGIARAILGDSIGTNMFMVGYASQQGMLPLSPEAIRQAIALNGTAVAFNQRAFELGRLCAHDPQALVPYLPQARQEASLPTTLEAARSAGIELLTQYQNAAYAERFSALVDRVARAERALAPESEQLAVATANSMAKLMAYKDEYEVARFYSDPKFMERLSSVFEGDFELRFNLAPPLLSGKDPNTGLPVKREYGGWMMKVFPLLAKFKFLRGTALDPFGYLAERRAERQLIEDFEQLMERVIAQLNSGNLPVALQLAASPMEIKGYGHVKDEAIDSVRRQQEDLWQRMSGQAEIVQLVDPAGAA
ncbi:indolepyruvate ferredoxin oxidoreductase family protein [Seongchinamella sediminis]|nr:indolepyruvate ferredoxin oxidoreductase family protein [Seongchinamella sediminis]